MKIRIRKRDGVYKLFRVYFPGESREYEVYIEGYAHLWFAHEVATYLSKAGL